MVHFSGVIALIILFTALLWFAVGWWVSSIERAKQQRNRENEWNHQLNTLRRDRDAFRDQVEVAHGKIRVLENRRADGKSPPRSPEDEAASRELTAKLQAHLEQAKQQITEFARKVDAMREQSIAREDVLETLRKKLTDTSRTLHDREQKLAELTGLAADSPEPEEAPAPTASDDRIARYEETIQKMRVDSQVQADAAEQDRQRLDHTISEHMQTIGALRAELAQRETGDTDSDNKIELNTIQSELDKLRQENQRHVEKIEQLSQGSKVVEHQRSRLQALQADYDEQRAVMEQLAEAADTHEKQLKEYENLREHSLTQQETIDSQHKTIADLQQRSMEREQEYDRELLDMRQAMEAQNSIVSQLREVLDKPTNTISQATSRPSPPAQPTVPPPMSGDLFARSTDEPDAGSTTSPSIRLYDRVPDSADDLKQISGIGPAFERALNDLGLFEFEQIAALSHDDIEWIAEALRSFPDRIVNGRWIEQAQQLITRRGSVGE